MNIYIADASPLSLGDAFNKYYNLMPEYRRNKIDRCKQEKDKCLSLCAGILLDRALSDQGKSHLLKTVTTGVNGKPVLEDDTIHFNLSHSGNMAMCVVADFPVGCDVQKIGKDNSNIARRFFAEDEMEYVFEDDNPENIRDRFYRLWVMKEAYVKLSGEGIAKDFKTFSVLDADVSFWEYEQDGYKYAVASYCDIDAAVNQVILD